MKSDQDSAIRTPSEQDQKPSNDGDALLDAARARARRNLPEQTVTLAVDQHWQDPPQQAAHQLCYRFDPERDRHQVGLDGVSISLDDPCRLLPVEIPKPWGREIWYSGMEARGESRVSVAGSELGLGTFLALAPRHLTSDHTPVLLKILDPLPTPVLGELYLEVHETKQEVYVVTAVDPEAWPEGRGRIRFGVNQAKRAEFADDASFRAAFLAALEAYEAVRAQVDAGAPDLAEQEAAARAECLTFTDERTLNVGDVIRVPTWVPHSLQQGVQVVEFQTPTYERFILSSSQKVLTQERWDSAHAVTRLELDTPEETPPETVLEHCQRIVGFDEFGVWQAELSNGSAITLPAQTPYAVAYCITGQVRLCGPSADLCLEQGEAALIPGSAIGCDIVGEPDCLLLLAAPGL